MCQKSWFSGSRLSFEKVLALTYCWAQTFTTGQVMRETSLDDKITLTETVIDWYYYCHEVRAHGIMNHHVGPIGEPGTTVEIDEFKLGRMKYHQGRKIEGKWDLVAFATKSRSASLSQ